MKETEQGRNGTGKGETEDRVERVRSLLYPFHSRTEWNGYTTERGRSGTDLKQDEMSGTITGQDEDGMEQI
ncbi:hypothetical protein Pcinc_017101 [Petrolisthes cinctipes]|uniref:Uncharacterized protein n=1 Tax=Petrolisthes cinctipes TaxID=88211 RepID=A0AAE1FRG5_PETCI|nr:hypothetical protein Pcinc_017101 [Petrolisthes cinctipes]